MANTTPVTIDSGSVRRVLRYVLWRVLAIDVVGPHGLTDALYDRGWREIDPVFGLGVDDGDAEYRMLRIAAITAAIRSVATAADGERLPLPVAPDELARALQDCLAALRDNDNLFWNLGPRGRDSVRGCRDAAVRLLDAAVATTEATELGSITVPAFSGTMRIQRLTSAVS